MNYLIKTYAKKNFNFFTELMLHFNLNISVYKKFVNFLKKNKIKKIKIATKTLDSFNAKNKNFFSKENRIDFCLRVIRKIILII